MKTIRLILLALLFWGCDQIEGRLDVFAIVLDTNWEFSQEDSQKWYQAKVPGVVHLDLLDNQLIDDPFWENNEYEQRWIEEENWVYKVGFTIEKEIISKRHIELEFDGLDTYAEVTLNGAKILFANNMFRKWSVPIKENILLGENELKIRFLSPIKFNQQKVEDYPYALPSGNETSDIITKVSPFIRKAAYHFGWDWAPRFVSSGIWRPVRLKVWNYAKIESIFTSTLSLTDSEASMLTRIEVEVDTTGEYTLIFDGSEKRYHLTQGLNKIDYHFTIRQPKIWWVNGLGEPNLYHQVVTLANSEQELDRKEIEYGVRTIELINKPDRIGTSFYFKLNGHPIFIKGANYVPQDVFLPRVQESQYSKLIGDVKKAGMNMLRVWGGGIYEEDLFYELCDANGILVWQDFMFAGSLYPDDQKFKENVKQEVVDNIKRLRGHPSIALWCGNNEIEVAWKNWGWQKQFNYSVEDSTEIWNNYKSIFHELIPQQLAILDPQMNYTPSSPLSNWGLEENFNHSSMHYWGVWHGREPFENFNTNVGRFMVEYGFQSFPELQTLKQVMNDSSLNLYSSAMKNRQKSYIGNGLILKTILNYYQAPENFENFILFSQQVQAQAMKMAIKAHKSKRPHCMGTMFWQLNDCWPGPSWSVIDYYGKHKLAYKAVQQEFSTQ